MPVLLRLALDENLRTLNRVFSGARSKKALAPQGKGRGEKPSPSPQSSP